jgi:hypothetical protein
MERQISKSELVELYKKHQIHKKMNKNTENIKLIKDIIIKKL